MTLSPCPPDVCAVLGIANPSDAVKILDDDEKGTNKVCTPGGEQNMIIISESGLYALIMRSNKPAARAFLRHEIIKAARLPSVRDRPQNYSQG